MKVNIKEKQFNDRKLVVKFLTMLIGKQGSYG